MQRLNKCRSFLLSSVIAIGVVGLAGCIVEERRPPPPPPTGPPPAVVEGYDYYYYPDEEVYFYPVTGVYFWAGGGGWHSGRRLPRTIVLRSEARVTVRLNTHVPYERHEDIRTRYPAHHAEPGHDEHGERGDHDHR